MAMNDLLTARLRKALSSCTGVKEKKMFRGIAFMLNDKLLASTGNDELMLRIDPALNNEVRQKRGTRNMVMKGKELKGWVYVKEESLASEEEFTYWINLALAFNAKAKSSKKKKGSLP